MSRWLHLYIFLVISACAHTAREDHSQFLRSLQEQDPAKQMEAPKDPYSQAVQQMWSKYLHASSLRAKNPGESCAIFYELSQNEQFKLKEVAFLRALSVCDLNFAPLKGQQISMEQYKGSYLSSTALDAVIAWQEKTDNRRALVDLYLQKSKVQTLQSEKLDSMDKALKLAIEFKLKDQVAQFQKRIESIAPRRKSNPKWEDLYNVAQDYRQARMFAEATEAYQKYMRHRKAGPNEGYLALKGLRELRRLTRQDDQELYLTSTKNLAKFTERMFKRTPNGPWPDRHHAMTVQWARTLWTYGKRDEAEKVLGHLADQLKGKHSLALIYWLRSRMDLEKEALQSSMVWLSLAQKEKITDATLQEDILWDIAWGHRKLGQLEEALVALDNLAEVTQSENQKYKSMFWKAKTLHQLQRDSDAKGVFAELTKEDLLGYYGQLAHNELGKPLTAIPSDPKLADAPEELDWLLAVHEHELALEFVRDLWQRRTKAKDLSDRETLYLLQLFARCGEFLNLFRHFATLEPDHQKKLIRENYSLLFPQIYSTEIVKASERFGVPAALILSIIRQESAFHPKARSWADAFGLMQLLPSVGRQMASHHKIPLENYEALYEPSTNIQLGTAFLRHLMNSHQGQLVIVVASYNASEKAIYNWIRTRYKGDALEFIEEIPYRETQGYVKLVLRNFVFYQRLLTDQKEVHFPSEFFHGLEAIQATLSQNENRPEN